MKGWPANEARNQIYLDSQQTQNMHQLDDSQDQKMNFIERNQLWERNGKQGGEDPASGVQLQKDSQFELTSSFQPNMYYLTVQFVYL